METLSTPPASSPLGKHKPKRRSIVLLALLAPLIIWFAGVQIVLRTRARDPHPPQQNGLTFFVQHAGAGSNTPTRQATGQAMGSGSALTQWFDRLFSLNPFASGAFMRDTEFPSVEIALPLGTKTGQFPAMARASTGDTFPLSCEDLFPVANSGKIAPHSFVRLPPVPATYQWLDITLDDKKGHRGTWRIHHLNPIKHALLPTVPSVEKQTVQGVPVEARAWWDNKAVKAASSGGGMGNTSNPFFGASSFSSGGSVFEGSVPVVAELRAVIPASALARPSQSWGVEIVSLTQEWQDGNAPLLNRTASRTSLGPGTTYAQTHAATVPHPAAQHVARIEAKLTRYEGLDESVTFRNVPLKAEGKGFRVRRASGMKGSHEVSLTTPSGIRLTLTGTKTTPQGTGASEPGEVNDVQVGVELSPGNEAVLPRSPLQKRVGKNQTLRISWNVLFDSDLITSLSSSSEASAVTLRYKKRLARPVLPELTVHVAQEAKLEEVPITFTVPVRAGKPKADWQNH